MSSRKRLSRLADQQVGLISLLCLSLGASVPAQAQTAADRSEAARQADILQRQNQERLQRDIESAMPSERAPAGIDTDKLMPKVDASAAGHKCRDISHITISGAPHLARIVKQNIIDRYIGHCLGVTEIEQILGEITKDYISRGYITTRVYLPQQDLSSGKLEILVLEGTLGKIKLEDGGRNSIRLGGVFPSAGELLNLRDLEQGIDQVNKLSSNNAQMDIKPGAEAGTSDVVISNTPGNPLHASVNTDNQGSESTGKNEAGVTVIGDRLLSLNELMLFTHREAVPNDWERKYSESNSFSFVVPIGYSTFSISTSRSRYVSTILAPSGLDLQFKGSSSSDSYRLDRTMYRNQSTRFSLSGTLTVKDSKSYLAGEYLAVSSRSLSVLDLGSNVSTGVLGGAFSMDVGYSKGLDFAGALKDPDNLPGDAPRAQFGKYTLGVSYFRPFRIGSTDYAFSSQFSGQRANDTLYGSEQMLIGGIYSVRGFTKNTLSGDHGYYMRNELSASPSLAIGDQRLPVRLYAGIDFGKVTNRVPNVPSGRLVGAAVGFSTSWKGASIDVFTTRPISMPDFFQREGQQTWIRVGYAI
jgi:hemolysin activation/secretion protein